MNDFQRYRKMRDEAPYKISEYIQIRFRYDFLCDIIPTKDEKARIAYLVDLDKDDLKHHLKFDRKGHLVDEEVEPAMELDAPDTTLVLESRFDDY